MADLELTMVQKLYLEALAEVSFISNPTENELLCNKNYQERAAEAIANGILEYLGK